MSNYTVSVTLQGNDQLTPTLRNANKELDNLQNAGTQSGGALDGLKNAVMGLGAAFTLAQVGQKAVELYNLGTAANNAENTFVQLSGGADAAAASLEAMRRATGGVVDDMTLMQGANKLLLMNLAGTGEEAARLTEIAVKLGSAMGNDAATSIADFAALLANQSIPRLDNFGISSDAVRKKLEELKAAGMDAQEAFSMAVMEEGAKSLDKLGAAAETSGGAVQRFLTNVGNAIQDFAQRFGTGVNSLAGIIEIYIGANPAQIEARDKAAADQLGFFRRYADEMMAIAGEMGMTLAEGFDPAVMLQSAYDIIDEYLAKFPTSSRAEALANAAQVIVDDMVTNLVIPESARADWEEAIGTMLFTMPDMETGVQEFQASVQKVNRRMSEAFSRASDPVIEGIDQLTQDRVQAIQDGNAKLLKEMQIEQAQITLEMASQSIEGNLSSILELLGQTTSASESLIPRYMTDSMAGAIQAQYDAAAVELERLKELADQGLISDADLANSQGMVDNMRTMADEATRAADAFDRIKLSDIFGQKDGGLQGQVTDAVIAQLQANGASPETIAAMQDALDLSSGRQTGASQFFAGTIAPAIAKLPPQDAAAIVKAYTDMLNQAVLGGFTPDKIQGLQTDFYRMMFGGGGGTLTVKPGDTLAGLSAQTGMSIDQLMQITGTTNPRLLQPGTYGTGGGLNTTMLGAFNPLSFLLGGTTGAGAGVGAGFGAGMTGTLADDTTTMSDNLQTMADNAQTFADTMTDVTDKSVDLRENIEALTAQTNVVTLELRLTGTDWDMLKQLGLPGANGRAQSVRDNGGRVRGTDSRMQRTAD